MEDPITTLENAGYRDRIELHEGTGAYSYVFSAKAGYLDHALANSNLAAQFTGATMWHINTMKEQARYSARRLAGYLAFCPVRNRV